jgi:hypothetical protein
MNELARILSQLQETDNVSAQFERELKTNPNDEIARINSEAVLKRRMDLERRLSSELRSTQADLVEYHVSRTEDEKYPVLAIAKAISGFQELVTSVFDALKSAPKQRYRPSAENAALSSLDFGMALPVGSVLVSMSIPNDRLIAFKTELDETFENVFKILNTKEPEALREIANRVGIASIVKAHDWAASTAQFGLNTKIKVQKDLTTALNVEISTAGAQTLKEIIEEKSDQKIESHQVQGELVGIDVEPPQTYFRLKTVDGRDLQGKLSDTFPRGNEWAVHVSYTAILLQVTTVRYSTGEEKVDWVLADLRPPLAVTDQSK